MSIYQVHYNDFRLQSAAYPELRLEFHRPIRTTEGQTQEVHVSSGWPFFGVDVPTAWRPPAWRCCGDRWEESTVCEPGHYLTLWILDHFPTTTLLKKYECKGKRGSSANSPVSPKEIKQYIITGPLLCCWEGTWSGLAFAFTLMFAPPLHRPHSESPSVQGVWGTTAQKWSIRISVAVSLYIYPESSVLWRIMFNVTELSGMF